MANRAAIERNVHQIQEQVEAAAIRSGRTADAVRLVAVTKYVDVEAARYVAEAGVLDLGESRPQDLWQKSAELADLPIRWHFIGHLQRNKIRRTLPLVSLMHSVDSQRLWDALAAEAAGLDYPCEVLLEVNISGQAEKHGFASSEIAPLLESISAESPLHIRGLMAMAHGDRRGEEARIDFAALRELRDQLLGACPQPHSLAELSMGMSGDFEYAIEEGATIVRVGSSLFEEEL